MLMLRQTVDVLMSLMLSHLKHGPRSLLLRHWSTGDPTLQPHVLSCVSAFRGSREERTTSAVHTASNLRKDTQIHHIDAEESPQLFLV